MKLPILARPSGLYESQSLFPIHRRIAIQDRSVWEREDDFEVYEGDECAVNDRYEDSHYLVTCD